MTNNTDMRVSTKRPTANPCEEKKITSIQSVFWDLCAELLLTRLLYLHFFILSGQLFL